jgi:hypothetical protein
VSRASDRAAAARGDRAGAVIAVGDSRDDALGRARAAADEIRFVVE